MIEEALATASHLTTSPKGFEPAALQLLGILKGREGGVALPFLIFSLSRSLSLSPFLSLPFALSLPFFCYLSLLKLDLFNILPVCVIIY